MRYVQTGVTTANISDTVQNHRDFLLHSND